MNITLTISSPYRTTSDTIGVGQDFDVNSLVLAFYDYINRISETTTQTPTKHVKGFPPQRPNNQNRVIVKYLDPNMRDREVYNALSKYVPIISLVRSCSRKSAFIRFENKKDAESIMKHKKWARKMEWAKPQQNKTSGPLKKPDSKCLLDCTLDELIELNMSPLELKECEIFDWVAEHGDCEYPYS